MPTASVNGIEICYETHGDRAGEPLLLIMGLGGQLVAWDDSAIERLVDRGYHVIRFDNRDVGFSTSFRDRYDTSPALTALLAGERPEPPYLLTDMAADAAGLLDHLELERVHVFGISMGGMIAQQLTIDHPHKVATLTSVMSTTGDPDVGTPTAEALTALMGSFGKPITTREEAIEASVAVWRVIGSRTQRDEERARRKAERAYDRRYDGTAVIRQLLAILSSPSRSEGLRGVTAPTLVIHGEADPLVQPSGGVRTAEVVPDGRLHLLPEMAHELDDDVWPTIADLLTEHTSRVPLTA